MIHFDVQFNLDGLAENVAKLSDDVQRNAAINLLGQLLDTTPIDTGRARAGWSMGDTHGSFVPETKKKPKGWKKGDAPLYPRPVITIPPKGAPFIIIYNNVEYIVPLNDGTTTRPPRRFVQESIDKVARSLK